MEGVAEETVGQLHDVRFVNASNLLPVVGKSKTESELGDALGLGASNDFERFDDTLHGLVLQARVFTLGVLTDNAEVNIVVARLVAGYVLDEDD